MLPCPKIKLKGCPFAFRQLNDATLYCGQAKEDKMEKIYLNGPDCKLIIIKIV